MLLNWFPTTRDRPPRVPRLALLAGALAALAACSSPPAEPAPGPALPRASLAFGGDLLLGNNLNTALLDPAARASVFGDIAPILRRADIALINAEGVISAGGEHFDKGDTRPHMFRAHPAAVEALTGAGIDVVSVGNNHVGDYGPAAFVEMLDRLLLAGIAYTGGGHDAGDARRPAYLPAGDLAVALVGANMTYARAVRARGDRAGTFHLPKPGTAADDRTVVELTEILAEARRHADLVLFTPHWGKGWSHETPAALRELAGRLIRAGYDGILGHSSHRLHGVELIDGKPVIYDAGNLGVYWTDDEDRSNQAMLFELELDRRGITAVTGHPVRLTENRTDLARGAWQKRILEAFAERSEKLGTAVVAADGVARVACDPGHDPGPRSAGDAPRRQPPAAVREAPRLDVLDRLPEGARPLDIRWPGGIRLVGVESVPEAIPRRKNAALVTLYWTADGPVSGDPLVHLETRGTGKRGKPFSEPLTHIAGDWLLPPSSWPAGKVIRDRTILRLRTAPPDPVRFLVGLDGLVPESAELPLVDGALVEVGRANYTDDGPGIFDVLRRRGAASR